MARSNEKPPFEKLIVLFNILNVECNPTFSLYIDENTDSDQIMESDLIGVNRF